MNNDIIILNTSWLDLLKVQRERHHILAIPLGSLTALLQLTCKFSGAAVCITEDQVKNGAVVCIMIYLWSEISNYYISILWRNDQLGVFSGRCKANKNNNITSHPLQTEPPSSITKEWNNSVKQVT